jgi:phosphoglycolate phosphatase
MNFQDIDTLIFDLDGTLIDSLEDLADSTNYALSEYGWPNHSIEDVRFFVGNGVRKLIERAVPADISTSEFEECFSCFKKHYALHCLDKTHPYPGIVDMLSSLKYNGYRLGIVSNKFDSAVKDLNQHFFSKYIHVAIGEKQNIRRKPAPDTVLAAMHELYSDPGRTIYVGDSDVDIETAKNANLSCVSVNWGFRSTSFLEKNGATCIVSEPMELVELVMGSKCI